MTESRALAVGDRIKDNDPRMNYRVLVVTRILLDIVVASKTIGDKTGETRISLNRIYTDDKPRRTGMECGTVKGIFVRAVTQGATTAIVGGLLFELPNWRLLVFAFACWEAQDLANLIWKDSVE